VLILRSLDFKPSNQQGFPFSLLVLKSFRAIEFKTPVSIFIGENGSGKSTILEALAYDIGLPTVSNQNMENDGSLKAGKALAPYLKLA
jgi:predicted ATPase